MKTVRNYLSVMLAFVLAFACACAAAEGDEWVCPDCGAANAMNFCLKCGAKSLRRSFVRNAERSFHLMAGLHSVVTVGPA